MPSNDPPPVEGDVPADAADETDEPVALEDLEEFAPLRWRDWALALGCVLVLAAIAVVLWLSVQGGGDACGPVHQALGHC